MTARLPLATLVLLLAPAAAAQIVQGYTGTLASGDPTLSTGEFADRYTITVPAGAGVLVASMVSTDVDSYLMVRGPGGAQEDNDDTADGNLNATLMLFDPTPGEWTVTATSARPGENGAYSLVLGAGALDAVLDRITHMSDSEYQAEGAPSARRPAKGGGHPAAGSAAVQIVNPTSTPIFYVYASECSATGWGEDRLGSEVISAGASWTLALTPGCWDLKVKYQDGQEVEKRSWTLAAGPATWTLGGK